MVARVRKLFPSTLNLGEGGDIAGKAASPPPHCMPTGKSWEISPPRLRLPSESCWTCRDGGAFASSFSPGRRAAAAAGTSPLPLPGSVLCPMDGCVCVLIPLCFCHVSAGKGRDGRQGEGQGEFHHRRGEGEALEEAWQVPSDACSPGDTFPWGQVLCESFTHPWKALSLPAPGARRRMMQALNAPRPCLSPAPDINSRPPACLCLLPSLLFPLPPAFLPD